MRSWSDWRGMETEMPNQTGVRQTSRKAVVLVLVVFVLGILLGALGTYIAGERVWARGEGRGSGKGRVRLQEQLTRELELNAEQQKQLAAILEETKKKYEALYEPVRSQADLVRQQGRENIRAILSPEQRTKFEEVLQRIDEERKKRGGR